MGYGGISKNFLDDLKGITLSNNNEEKIRPITKLKEPDKPKTEATKKNTNRGLEGHRHG